MSMLLNHTRHSYASKTPSAEQLALFDYLLTLKPVVDRLNTEQLSNAVYTHGAKYFCERLCSFHEQIAVTKKVRCTWSKIFLQMIVLFITRTNYCD